MRQNLRLLRFAQEALLLLLLGVASNMVRTLPLPLTLTLALALTLTWSPLAPRLVLARAVTLSPRA